MVDDTLCPKGDNEYHKLVCLKRECSECGVQAVNFSISELNDNSNNDSVTCKWSKYEYITPEGCENADGTPRKKLSILSKETSLSEMVNYLKQLLQSYPYNQFMSFWQKSQFESLKQNLPIDNVLYGHDYSENYECSYQEEVQSQYFSKTEASIHVTILYRHASQEFDNCASTEEQPKIIKEYIFVISDDMAHDSYSVQHVRHIIHNYLVNTVGCRVKRLHEFTDGCSAQYKSRHCMGSHVLLSSNDFGYPALCDYFETSHAKGEQDAAGAHIKQKANLAVVRREATIQSAEQLCSFFY